MQEETRKTMSVREMGELLGLKKTDSYWLIHKEKFQTITVCGKTRVVIESFEKWYANQVKYKKVGGPPPGDELRRNPLLFRNVIRCMSCFRNTFPCMGETSGRCLHTRLL